MNGIREFSVAGFIFSYARKYFLALLGGGAMASIAPHGSSTDVTRQPVRVLGHGPVNLS